jgi:hypothetical protein
LRIVSRFFSFFLALFCDTKYRYAGRIKDKVTSKLLAGFPSTVPPLNTKAMCAPGGVITSFVHLALRVVHSKARLQNKCRHCGHVAPDEAERKELDAVLALNSGELPPPRKKRTSIETPSGKKSKTAKTGASRDATSSATGAGDDTEVTPGDAQRATPVSSLAAMVFPELAPLNEAGADAGGGAHSPRRDLPVVPGGGAGELSPGLRRSPRKGGGQASGAAASQASVPHPRPPLAARGRRGHA